MPFATISQTSQNTRIRRVIIEEMQVRLKAIGFSFHDSTTSWRWTNVKVDIFHFDLLNSSTCRKLRVPSGSFSVFPECFFPALPSLSAAWEECDATVERVGPVPPIRAQLRWQVLKGIRQTSCPQKIIYCLDDIESVKGDLIYSLEKKIVPFWSRYEDPAELLRTLLEDNDVTGVNAEGPVDIGELQSHMRLFYLGFVALWMENFQLALSTLVQCRDHPKWRPLKVAGAFDTRPVLNCIERGIAQAQEGLTAKRPTT